MEAQELIKKINDIVDEAIEKSKKTMDENERDLSANGTAAFYKASGINNLAHEIKMLLIKEGGML